MEAVPIRKALGVAVAKFIKEHIIYRFGVLQVILFDNGTPFVNKDFKDLLRRYHVKHYKSSPYYPKGNGQAKATNKTLIKISSKTLDDHLKDWAEQLPMALWTYHTSKRKPTGETPYNLVYGEEAILPAEITIPSTRLRLRSHTQAKNRAATLEALGDFREEAHKKIEKYHERLQRQYNTSVIQSLGGRFGAQDDTPSYEGIAHNHILSKVGRTLYRAGGL